LRTCSTHANTLIDLVWRSSRMILRKRTNQPRTTSLRKIGHHLVILNSMMSRLHTSKTGNNRRSFVRDLTFLPSTEAVALQEVTMKVSASQQLTVCGRTGRYVGIQHHQSFPWTLADTFCGVYSGKSTLLLALLRLVDIKFGTIKVDGLDLSLIPRSLIRQRCFITVSQDMFILAPASLRLNFDVRETPSHSKTI